ncbi:response regulator [Pseudobacteriovorax antillogorgiicola]|uniref:Response regulator receiver domain-containing protein n=1 Tax=Pseudobacteriovorax antillogorgiicola TaxID=1513793 RepID=A0A1Y6BWW8_9BACT|nr:response regulator [Pseudobacteriovorax antillogorgiicola]TCS53151.1 response regulator receiver domain-containing protein [Pseudobacteriovorax antillogorgiicola]SMF25158.1 Response regulator receiver domain-containing protein [Pseudobacteriovorax antillogorgiicola]
MSKSKLRVLYVDDDPCQLEVAKELLTLHFDVEVAFCTRKAMEILDDDHFDLLITDIEMPQESGFTFAKKVRGRHPELGMIAVSGGDQDSVEQFRQESISLFFDYIQKPVQWDDLITRYSNDSANS